MWQMLHSDCPELPQGIIGPDASIASANEAQFKIKKPEITRIKIFFFWNKFCIVKKILIKNWNIEKKLKNYWIPIMVLTKFCNLLLASATAPDTSVFPFKTLLIIFKNIIRVASASGISQVCAESDCW